MHRTDSDWRLRLAAFARMEEIQQLRGGIATYQDLKQGFEFDGERIPLFDPRRGIWRPRQLGRHGAALTVVTAPPPKPGRTPAYDDQVASDHGWFVYRYEGTDPHRWSNVAVRRAIEDQRPLIYLYGIAPGIYDPIVPAYVVDDDPEDLSFHLVTDLLTGWQDREPSMVAESTGRRAYATASVKVRLHQQRFRHLVIAAYREACAICRIRHLELLDAAHILPDRDERGRPEVPNGLALCKIHHAAYDASILGISPDYEVHVRDDVLREHDGPMLRHGLQEISGKKILVPRRAAHRPNPEFLEERFTRFRAA